MEKNIPVGHVSATRACPSSVFPTEEKYCPFPLSSTSPRQHLQTRRQRLLLSGSPIGPG